MKSEENYIKINKESWNNRTDVHIKSDFYDMDGFMYGKSSLKSIELDLLGDVSGKSILHLQCHFGQDTLSLSRMGAKVTGIDLSDKAIKMARIDRKVKCRCRIYLLRFIRFTESFKQNVRHCFYKLRNYWMVARFRQMGSCDFEIFKTRWQVCICRISSGCVDVR